MTANCANDYHCFDCGESESLRHDLSNLQDTVDALMAQLATAANDAVTAVTAVTAERDAALVLVDALTADCAQVRVASVKEADVERLKVARLTEALSRLVKVYDVRETKHDGVLGMDWCGGPDNNTAGFAWNEALLTLAKVAP